MVAANSDLHMYLAVKVGLLFEGQGGEGQGGGEPVAAGGAAAHVPSGAWSMLDEVLRVRYGTNDRAALRHLKRYACEAAARIAL